MPGSMNTIKNISFKTLLWKLEVFQFPVANSLFKRLNIDMDQASVGQFMKLHLLRKRNMCVKVSDTVLQPITGLRITFGTYMEAFLWAQWEDNSTHPSFPYSAITLQIDCLGQFMFMKLHPFWKRNMCVKVSDTVLQPITGLRITFGTYTKALGTMGR